MKVLKFGGSSLKSSSSIKKVIQRIYNDKPIGVVVSAAGGTTDQILEIIASSEMGNDHKDDLSVLLKKFILLAKYRVIMKTH